MATGGWLPNCNDLLHAALARDARQIDEKLFFDVFAIRPPKLRPPKLEQERRR